jgi:hypothetical protein
VLDACQVTIVIGRYGRMRSVRPVVALDTAIRSSRRIHFFAGYLWLFAGGMLLLGGMSVPRFDSREGLVSALAGAALFGGIALAAIWCALRVQRTELRMSSSSVVVRNPIRCHTVPLDEVVKFQPGNATPNTTNGTPGIVLRLTSGHALPVWALAEEGSIFSVKKRTLSFTPLADDLNALLAATRGASVS